MPSKNQVLAYDMWPSAKACALSHRVLDVHPVCVVFSSIAVLDDVSTFGKVPHDDGKLAWLEAKDCHPNITVLLQHNQEGHVVLLQIGQEPPNANAGY